MITRISVFAQLLALLVLSTACESLFNEETGPELGPPIIQVTASNPTPFPGDTILFTIEVNAAGELATVAFEEMILKNYPAGQMMDVLTHQIVIPEGLSFGPQDYDFVVIDRQIQEKRAAETIALDIQNPTFRGNPKLVANFNSIPPDPFILQVFADSTALNEAAYQIKSNVIDPKNDNNRVISVIRNSVLESAFNGHGGIQVPLVNNLEESDVQGLINGTRVLQMNVFLDQQPKLASAHMSPEDPVISTADNIDFSWTFENDVEATWNFNLQKETDGIPILIELGNDALWNKSPTNPMSGRSIYLIGSLSKVNEWETVTFSVLQGNVGYSPDGKRSFEALQPIGLNSGVMAIPEDNRVSNNSINRLAIQPNSRVTEKPNTEGWFQLPDTQNNFTSDIPVPIIDNHNSYLIDNLRIIDTDQYDKNPNF